MKRDTGLDLMRCHRCGGDAGALNAAGSHNLCDARAEEEAMEHDKQSREPERAEIINESDVVCGGCGADPRAEGVDAMREEGGWFVDAILKEDGTWVAEVRCPRCW